MNNEAPAKSHAEVVEKTEKPKLSFPLIDILKFVFALGIMAAHLILESGTFPWLFYPLSIISQLGVAFFFISSGFLSAKKADQITTPRQRSFSYLKIAFRHAILYSLWSLVYFLILLCQWLTKGFSISDSLLLFIRNFFIGGSYGQLWFLWALVICDLVFALFSLIRINHWITFGLSLVLYLLFLLIGPYGFIFNSSELASFTNLWFFPALSYSFGRGFLYISLGVLCCKLTAPKNNWLLFLSLFLSVAFYSIEFSLLEIYQHSFASIAFSLPVFSFLSLALCQTLVLPATPTQIWMRKMSILIYVIHVAVFILYNQLIKVVSIPSLEGFIPFLLVGSFTIGLSAFIVFLSAKPKMRFLHYLY